MNSNGSLDGRLPVLLVLASTYPRWAGDPEPGFVHELAKRLIDRFRVIVLCPHAPGALSREILDGVEILRFRYAPVRWETLVNDGGIITNLRLNRWKCLLVPGFVLSQFWRAWRLACKEKIDVIHAHWLLPQGLIAALLRTLPRGRIPFLVTSHGADLHALQNGLFDRIKRFVSNKATAVTVVSSVMREKLQRLGVDSTKVSVLPMGVDLQDRFSPDASVQRSCQEILFVGRLVEKKGVRHLLSAVRDVALRIPDVQLTIVGFGPEEVELKAQTARMGLDDVVRFVGAVPQDELPALYRRAALFVAPFVRARSGDEEGLGLVLVEAIGCGCPILAGNVPALKEVLGDGFDDMTVDPLDVDRLSSQIFVALNEAAASRQRAACLREAIGERFDWDRVADGYGQLLESLAGSALK